MRNGIGLAVVAGAAACFAALGNQSDAPLPEFEIASIKPTDITKDVLVDVRIYPGGRLEIRGTSLAGLITQAFLPIAISGGPDWVYRTLYEVVGLPPKPVQDTVTDLHSRPWIGDERLRQMLQALVIRRFQLQYRYESKEGDVYFLRTGNRPIAARPTEAASDYATSARRDPITGGLGHWRLRGVTMAELAYRLSTAMRSPVVDETGLQGAYDYQQPPLATDAEHRPDYVESLLSLVREMNLKIVKGKGQVKTLVILSAQHPAEN